MWVLITLKRETETDTRWIHVEKDEKMTYAKKKKKDKRPFKFGYTKYTRSWHISTLKCCFGRWREVKSLH